MKEEVLKYYLYQRKSSNSNRNTAVWASFILVYRKRERFFCAEYNLDLTKKYICYSGDDETTALDQYYLEDLAMVVRNLNAKGENLGIISKMSCGYNY
jgi:hypothetical protein